MSSPSSSVRERRPLDFWIEQAIHAMLLDHGLTAVSFYPAGWEGDISTPAITIETYAYEADTPNAANGNAFLGVTVRLLTHYAEATRTQHKALESTMRTLLHRKDLPDHITSYSDHATAYIAYPVGVERDVEGTSGLRYTTQYLHIYGAPRGKA